MIPDHGVVYDPAILRSGAIQVALPGGGETEIRIRRSARARHMLLHVDAVHAGAELVLPSYATLDEGLDFVFSKRRWLKERLGETLPPVPFADGTRVPLMGTPLVIRRVDMLFPDIWREHGELIVACPAAELAVRVQGWFMTEAGGEIRRRARHKAAQLGRGIHRIAIRDPRTMWGSCSPKSNLSFSWRLVMAPEEVLDYVVAHEVAHLIELNHTRRFWDVVETLCDDVEGPREWLRGNGAALHRYGAEAPSRKAL